MLSVMWPPMAIARGDNVLTLRVATTADAPSFDAWDRDPGVIAAATDDRDEVKAFSAIWVEELGENSDVSCFYVAELDARPIGAMQVTDPREEPSHYWGEIEPDLRAIDIWIGSAADRSCGHGTAMMRAVVDKCFEPPAITAIVIDPLASNTRAHRFYQRMGFKPVGRQMLGDDDTLVHRLDRRDWIG